LPVFSLFDRGLSYITEIEDSLSGAGF